MNKKNIKGVAIVAVLVLLAAGCNKQAVSIESPKTNPPPTTVADAPSPSAEKPKKSGPTVTIGGHTLNVEIADTQEAQLQGLTGRAQLPPDGGMLFVMPEKHRYTFWMKGMLFPLDIIWIKAGQVTQISAQAQPEPGVKDSNLKIYIPDQTVDTVLEVNAGWAAQNKIKVGDRVDVRR